MNDDATTPRYANFPDLDSILDNRERAKCKELFDELTAINVSLECLKARSDEIKLELDHFQNLLDGPGIRHGQFIYSHQYIPGRRTLDKGLLMANGVSKAILDDSMLDGKPYERREFRDLEKKRKKGGPGEDPLEE